MSAHKIDLPPPAAHPAITHCDDCGCDWLDNGLNPVGCPYCEQRATAAQVAEIEALREDAERWRALREMDGGEIYALLGDCDGIHPEQADAAIDAMLKAREVRND